MTKVTQFNFNIKPTVVGGESIPTINARELHTELGVGKDYSNWIKDRITKYDFVENQDFTISLANFGDQDKHGGHNRKDYHISLDMAKELAMVENNAKGRAIRKYFIECEKELRNVKPELDVESMLLLALETERERKRLALINKEQEAKIQQDAPKVQMAEDFLIVDAHITMEAMAKLLCNIEGVKIGRTKLYNKLRDWGVVMPNTTTPYQRFIDSELFACREKQVERSNGTVEIKISTLVTPKGQLALIKKVRKLLKEGTWSNI